MQPNEVGLYADARAARRWLAERAGVPEGEIILYGESLGGAVMVELASRDGARGLILENTFTSLPDVAAVHYPIFPARRMMRNRFDSINKVPNYHGPLLQFHGDEDRTVPIDLGLRLFNAASHPKKFVRLENHRHNFPLPVESHRAVAEFVAGVAKRPEEAAVDNCADHTAPRAFHAVRSARPPNSSDSVSSARLLRQNWIAPSSTRVVTRSAARGDQSQRLHSTDFDAEGRHVVGRQRR